MTQPYRPRQRRAERHVDTPPHVRRNRIFERFLRDGDTDHLPHRDAEEAFLLVDAAVQHTRIGGKRRRPVPDGEDCLAALAQRTTVQELDDIRELQIIEHARALDVPWREIGLALEYPARRAKQDAYRRFHTLAGRYPYALAANRRPEGCGVEPGCTCNPQGLIRPTAGCDDCPHCHPTTEEPTGA